MKRGRQKKVRYIQRMPKVVQFSPRGKAGRPDEVELKVDEYEAFKLADFQGYHQDEGAKAMGISRPSFGRILRNARKIVADALVNGKIIRIRIGDVQVGVRRKDLAVKPSRVSYKSVAVKRDVVAANLPAGNSNSLEKMVSSNILNYRNNNNELAQ
ncbi:MAG: DUF134 domain-containing protein [Candidatus Omnitrophica bacterium]|nr:DUF134 domain-containing protein [Candidatus Omnitrophota bacterium]